MWKTVVVRIHLPQNNFYNKKFVKLLSNQKLSTKAAQLYIKFMFISFSICCNYFTSLMKFLCQTSRLIWQDKISCIFPTFISIADAPIFELAHKIEFLFPFSLLLCNLAFSFNHLSSGSVQSTLQALSLVQAFVIQPTLSSSVSIHSIYLLCVFVCSCHRDWFSSQIFSNSNVSFWNFDIFWKISSLTPSLISWKIYANWNWISDENANKF
jgi:hypothetical protein